MPKIQCQAILFDLDGVLIDSTRAVARVWHRWAVEHGFTRTRSSRGRTAAPASLRFANTYPMPITPPRIAKSSAAKWKTWKAWCSSQVRCGCSRSCPRPLDHRDLLHPAAGRDTPPGRGLARPGTHDHIKRHKERQAASRALPERRIGPGLCGHRLCRNRRRACGHSCRQGSRCDGHRLQNHG